MHSHRLVLRSHTSLQSRLDHSPVNRLESPSQMVHYNPAMNYPRHNTLVVCDWVNLVLAVAVVAVGAYRTWGITSKFVNRMDIVVITAVSPYPRMSTSPHPHADDYREENRSSFSSTSSRRPTSPPSSDGTMRQRSLSWPSSTPYFGPPHSG